MAYVITNPDGTTLTSIPDDSTKTVGGLQLIGKNLTQYGGPVATSFVRLLQNFASTDANRPGRPNPADPTALPPLHGQLWVRINSSSSASSSLMVYNENSTLVDKWQELVLFRNNGETVVNGVASSARYADIAERFEASEKLEKGHVVCIGGDKDIVKAKIGDRVLGIISTNPAFRMNCDAGDDDTHPYVGYLGRIPAKIVEGETVARHSPLYLSTIPGYLTTHQIGEAAFVATALEDGEGVVLVALGR